MQKSMWSFCVGMWYKARIIRKKRQKQAATTHQNRTKF